MRLAVLLADTVDELDADVEDLARCARLERRDLQTGLVTMCTGGGMGTATIIERI